MSRHDILEHLRWGIGCALIGPDSRVGTVGDVLITGCEPRDADALLDYYFGGVYLLVDCMTCLQRSIVVERACPSLRGSVRRVFGAPNLFFGFFFLLVRDFARPYSTAILQDAYTCIFVVFQT